MATSARAAMAVRSGRAPREAGGFTLIELLVVIAVILILAALAMPVLNKAISGGQSAACKSNLQQIGAGFIGYANQFSQIMPRHNDNEPVVIDQGKWWLKAQGLLVPFVPDFHVFECGADDGVAGELGGPRWHSYGYNTNYWTGSKWVTRKWKNIATIEQPSQALIFLDNNERDGGVDGNNDRGYQDGPINNPAIGLQRHHKGFNAVFVDRHVDFFKVGGTTEENYTWHEP
jgi:prepilin-type N-terminal cleavage/methylation domain-containing protein